MLPLRVKIIFSAIIIIVLLLFVSTITCVPAGNVGVANRFGTVFDTALSPGIQMKPLFSSVHTFSIRTQEIKESMKVPTSEGLIASVDVSGLFRLDPARTVKIYKEIGPDYIDVIVVPGLRNTVRDVIAEFKAEALYSQERNQISKMVEEKLSGFLGTYGVFFDKLLLRDLVLPPKLTDAIESKMQADQAQQAMKFILEKERSEAERKRIEAAGIRDFQKTVSEGISEQLLRWKGIEATEKIAQSQNSKIVVIGGKDGLPLILNSGN